MTQQTPLEAKRTGRNAALWVGVLAPPLAWLFLLQANYSVVTSNCQTARPGLLHALTVGGLLLTLVAGVLCWRSWRAVRGEPGSLQDRDAGRARFMAVFGLVESAFFALVILASAIPTFLLRPCD